MNNLNSNIKLRMTWSQVVCTINNDTKYIFSIKPMYKGDDICYIPIKNDEYKEIIERIKSVNWNRDIRFVECEIKVKCLEMNKNEFEAGTLESTKAAQEFNELEMFNPEFEMDRSKVHELWCILEKRFAEAADGIVSVKSYDISEGSVFDKITLPTLLSNKKAHVYFID